MCIKLRKIIETRKLILIFSLLLGLSVSLPPEENKNSVERNVLVSVAVLYRHGDRNPENGWPTDPYFSNTTLWPEGYGELTDGGILRAYNLGAWLRSRYNTFLSPKYSKSEIYVRSTNVDRALMSAESVLAGLYPPLNDSKVTFQPVPIQTMPQDMDQIIAMKVPCPKHDQLVSQLLESEKFQKINKNNGQLFKELSNYTGLNITDFRKMSMLYTTLTIERGRNLEQPAWVDEYFPDKLRPLAALKFQYTSYTQDLARLRTGPFFYNLLTQFKGVVQNLTSEDASGPKFFMFSGHDGTIGDILQSMGSFNDVPPEFSSTIIWEVWKNGASGKMFVNLLFRNSTALAEMKLRDCDFNCDFDNFENILKPITVDIDTWKSECASKS